MLWALTTGYPNWYVRRILEALRFCTKPFDRNCSWCCWCCCLKASTEDSICWQAQYVVHATKSNMDSFHANLFSFQWYCHLPVHSLFQVFVSRRGMHSFGKKIRFLWLQSLICTYNLHLISRNGLWCHNRNPIKFVNHWRAQLLCCKVMPPKKKLRYQNAWERFVEAQSTLQMPSILKYEAMQELPQILLSRVPCTDAGRWFFLCSDAATDEVLEAMAVYVVAREAIRNYGPERCAPVFTKLKEIYEGTTWARVLTAPTLLGRVRQLRLTNINNFWDRGSFRMRFIAAALLHVAVQEPQAPLYGGALTLATIFSVITGGPGMCTWFQQQLQVPWPD